jgi:SNF2 family DNA or RNA helicase
MSANDTWRSTKIGLAMDTIAAKNRSDPNIKTLVFEPFKPDVEVFCIGLEARGIEYVKIHGDISRTKRNQRIKDFQQPGGPKLLVCTPQSIGNGLNLPNASEVHLLNPHHTPSVEDQCIARAYRIGKLRPVCVYRYRADSS